MKIDFKSPEDLSYIAGALESRQNSILVSKGLIIVSFRQRGELPEILHHKFGGSGFHNGRAYWWKLTGRKASEFLRLLLPYFKDRQNHVKMLLNSDRD